MHVALPLTTHEGQFSVFSFSHVHRKKQRHVWITKNVTLYLLLHEPQTKCLGMVVSVFSHSQKHRVKNITNVTTDHFTVVNAISCGHEPSSSAGFRANIAER